MGTILTISQTTKLEAKQRLISRPVQSDPLKSGFHHHKPIITME